jgi:hypothetical protein
MAARSLTIALACALSLLAAPAAAGASTLRGSVAGSPYVASATSAAIPVLLSRTSARAARLVSPVGVLLVSRQRKLTMPARQGAILPLALHLGDQFTASARVPADQRRAVFVRLVVPAGGLRITQHTTTPSNDELGAQLAALQSSFATLQQVVSQLGAYTVQNIDDLGNRVASLATSLGSLTTTVSGLQSQVGALSSALTAAQSSLQAQIAQVRSDLQPQVDALVTQIGTITTTLGSNTCTPTPDLTTVFGQICAVQNAVSALGAPNLTNLTNRVDQISSALTNTVDGLTGLSLSGDLPANLSGPVNSALAGLLGTVGQVSTLNGSVSSLSGLVGGVNVPALQSTLATVSGSLTGLTSTVTGVGGLQSVVGNLITDLGAGVTGTNPTALNTLSSTVGSLQGSVTTLQGLVGGVNVSTLNSTVSTLVGTTIPGINANLSSVCTAAKNSIGSLITTLGSATLPSVPVLNLLSILSGNTQQTTNVNLLGSGVTAFSSFC